MSVVVAKRVGASTIVYLHGDINAILRVHITIQRYEACMAPTATSNTQASGYLAQLRQHQHDFAVRYHVASLGIFGSYVRNE